MTVPDAAVAAAAEIHKQIMKDFRGSDAAEEAIARAVLEAAAPAIRADERAKVYAELGSDHYVIFTQDRWTVEHSVECRLSGQMPECAYHAAIARIADEPYPEMLGRWRIDGILGSDGFPDLTRAELPGGPQPAQGGTP